MMSEDFKRETEYELPTGAFSSECALSSLTNIQVEIILPHLFFHHLDSQYQEAKMALEKVFPNHHKYVVEGKWHGEKQKCTKFVIVTLKRNIPAVRELVNDIGDIMKQREVYAVYKDVVKLGDF